MFSLLFIFEVFGEDTNLVLLEKIVFQVHFVSEYRVKVNTLELKSIKN